MGNGRVECRVGGGGGHKRLEYLGVEKMEGWEACTATSSSSRNSATAEQEEGSSRSKSGDRSAVLPLAI